MTQTRIYYRLTIYAEDGTTPVIVLSSHPDAANALLCEAPDGDGQKIDPIEGKLEVGSYTWQAIDRFDGGDTYAITALLSDVDARNQLLSNKCVGEYSNDGSSWTVLHTGYLNDITLSDAKTYTFSVGDTDRRERDAVLFKTISDTFDRVSNVIGGPVEADTPVAYQGTPTRAWGPIIDYGPARMQVIANPSGLVNPSNRITLSLTGANLPPRYLGFQSVWNGKVPNPAEYIDQQTYQYYEADADGIYATDGSQQSQPWGSFPQLEVKLTAVVGGAVTKSFPIAQAARKASSYVGWPGGGIPDFPKGDEQALVANSNDWLIVAWDTATMGSAPSVGTNFDVLVRPKVISEDNPLHLNAHPIDLHIAANVDQNIPYDAASAATTKTALGPLVYQLRITGEWEYSKFVEMLKGSAGYATRYNSDGEQEFFPTRLTQPSSVATLTTANIIGDERGEPKDVIFKVSESTVIKGVDYKLKQFRLWNPNTDNPDERPVDGVIADDLTINGTRRDDAVYGSKILTFEVPGMILLSGGALILNQPLALRVWIEGDDTRTGGGEVIIDRCGWGLAEGEVEVLDTVAGDVGDYVDVEHPAQVNALTSQSPVTQRGGTRKMQIVSVTRMPGTKKLKLVDAGNLAQDPPEAPDNGGTELNPALPVPELSLAASTDNPTTVATVTETNVTELQDVGADTELQYLVQTDIPASTDEGTDFGPLLSSTGEDTIDAPAILSGQTLWVRGRATALGQVGEWSTWISITLGPDDDGTEGSLPPFLLALTINSAGLLSAEATSVDAAIVTVYFLAGAAGGSAPLYDDVLASSFVDTDGPPFTSGPTLVTEPTDALATMAEGETRTVGAIGEDALGNRTLLVTATITRSVNTGSATGTPGTWGPLTMRAGPPLVLVGVPEALTEPRAAWTDRIWVALGNVEALLLQGGSGRSNTNGVYMSLVYSLTGVTGTFVDLNTDMPLDAIRYPSLSDVTLLLGPDNPARAADRVCLSWAVGGGDGTPASTVEVSNIYVTATATTETPDIPSDPPTIDDVPSGGDFCDIIHDLNALTTGLADGDPVTTWTDDSTSGDDAAPDSGASQTAPTFVEDAFGTGLHAVRMVGDQGVKFLNPTGDSFTRYFVCKYAAAPTMAGATLFDGTTGGNNALGAFIQNDGKILAQVNDEFIFPSSDTTNNAWDGATHVHCWTFSRLSGHWAWYVDDMTTAAVEAEADCQSAFTSDAVAIWMGYRGVAGAGTDWGRELTYSCAHGEAQRLIVAAVLSATWVTGGGGSSGGEVEDGGTTTPPTSPPGATPPYVGTTTDASTGATITRITGDPGTPIPVVGGTWDNLSKHGYSKRMPWSKDETYIALERGSWSDYLIIDGVTYEPIKNFSTPGRVRWDPNNDSKFIFVKSNGDVGRVDVITEVQTTVVSAGAAYTSADLGPSEGNVSYDGRYLVVQATRSSDSHKVAWLVDLTGATRGTDFDLTAAGLASLDWISVSAGGGYVVLFGNDQHTRVYNRSGFGSGSTPIQTWTDWIFGHADLGMSGGNEVMWGMSGGPTYGKQFVTRRLDTGAVTLTTNATTYAGHASTRSDALLGVGFGVVNTPGSEDGTLDRKIFKANLDGSGVTVICSHSSNVTDYYSEPHAVPNHDGTKVMSDSNMGASSGRPVGVYVVTVP